MTPEVKKILGQKLAEAMKFEGLDQKQAGQSLGLKSKYYISMIIGGKANQIPKVSKAAWERVKDWTNSGETIKRYSEKYNLYAEFPVKSKIVQNGIESGEVDRETIVEQPVDLSEKELEVTAVTEKPEEGRFRVEMEIKDKPRIQDVPLDRLKMIFDAINELKEMGYQVDINICAR